MVNDGDHLLMVVRKDLVENAQANAEYKAKYGKDLGCPDTMAEWAQQAAFFQTKEGDTRWGIKFDKGLSGGLGYRSVNFSYRHFPVYMKGLAVRQGHEAAHHHVGRHPGHQGFRRRRRVHAQGHPGLGHAADLSLLGQRARLLGHVVSLHLRLRRKQSQQRRQGQAARLPDPWTHGRRQARAPLAAGRRHRLHGERLCQEPRARLPLHPVVHEPEHRRRGRGSSQGLLGSLPPLEPDAQGHSRPLRRGHGQDDHREHEIRGLAAS